MRTPSIDESVRRVVWDWNGTLIDDLDLVVDVVNGLLGEAGAEPLERGRYRELFDFPVRRFYERLGLELTDDAFADLARRFATEYGGRAPDCTLQSGVDELLPQLAERGIVQSILSAAHRDDVEALLQHHGLRQRMDDVVAMDDRHGGEKTEIGRRWVSRRGVRANQTVLIGDTVHDFEVARALGMRCVLVANGHHSRARLEACDCVVVGDLRELVVEP